MQKKKLFVLYGACMAMGFASLLGLVLYTRGKDGFHELRVLPVLGKAPAFTMTDATNQQFSSDQLQGKVYVADFFFSNCGGPCPTMGKNMTRIRDQSPLADLHLVSISVDPVNDVPEKLEKYARKFSADPNQWHFLTAPEEVVREVSVLGFKMGDEVIINHSTFFALVDRNGLIRGYYDGTDEADVGRLIEDLALLK